MFGSLNSKAINTHLHSGANNIFSKSTKLKPHIFLCLYNLTNSLQPLHGVDLLPIDNFVANAYIFFIVLFEPYYTLIKKPLCGCQN